MTIVFQDRWFQKYNGTYGRYGCFLDPTLKYNFDNFLIKGVKHGHDGIVLITGLEGTGKSTFTQQIAAYCDCKQTLDLSRIVFTGRDLMKAIDVAAPETALIFDEAIMDMSSQDFATEMQKILIKKFTLIRKKRLYIFIVIPSVFMLRKYFAIFRTRAMINCYCPDGITRGYFRFYSFATKKKLYLRGYKEMDMGAVKPDFSGTFVDTYGFFTDADAYEAKKDAAIKKLTEDDDSAEEKLKQAFEDYKLKLKIEVEQFKSNWKDKFGEQRAKYIEKMKKLREEYSSKYKDIKEKSIDLQKSTDKKKIKSLQQDYAKLMYFIYVFLEKDFKFRNPDDKFNMNAFHTILTTNLAIDFSVIKLKSVVEQGKNFAHVEQKFAMKQAEIA